MYRLVYWEDKAKWIICQPPLYTSPCKQKYYNHKNHHRLYPHNNHHDNNHHATLSHKESHLHLPGLRKLSGTLPGDDQAAAIQTVSISVTKYMGSHGCLALHGWARLHQLPNPFFPSRLFSRQSYSESASSRRHAVQSFPCRTAMLNTAWKKLEGAFPLIRLYRAVD